jgi:hypothetical protein
MTALDAGWRHHAACRHNPDLFTGDKFGEQVSQDAARAIHICLNHCPAYTPCYDDTQTHPPKQAVQGGVLYGVHSRPAASQPEPFGCGPWCAKARQL